MRIVSPKIKRLDKLAARGVSLLEVLVSLLILSIGLLGLAGLQSKALRYSQSAMFRSQATILADDILERMRVDRENVLKKKWTTTFADRADADITTNTDFANREIRDWKNQVETLLPSSEASIQLLPLNDPNPRRVTIRIKWDDSRGQEPLQTFVTQTQF